MLIVLLLYLGSTDASEAQSPTKHVIKKLGPNAFEQIHIKNWPNQSHYVMVQAHSMGSDITLTFSRRLNQSIGVNESIGGRDIGVVILYKNRFNDFVWIENNNNIELNVLVLIDFHPINGMELI